MRIVKRREIQSLFLSAVSIAQMFLVPTPVHADPLSVEPGTPNIWSLEQAHYLLARIRERNLGLRNRGLEEKDLDPNAVNATRLDALRSIFELGVSFDQQMGFNNRESRQNLEFNQDRRQELVARRSALFDDKARLLAQQGTLNAELKNLEENEANADAIKQKQREISANEQQRSAVDDQIKNISDELTLVGTGNTTLTSPSQSAPQPISGDIAKRIGERITDAAAEEIAKNSRLSASVKLDNYVQMQYELLAKQLTLLRDEVGPKERLMFLELPTSIYAPPKSESGLSAEAWWRIDGVYRQNRHARVIKALDEEARELSALEIAASANPSAASAATRHEYDLRRRAIDKLRLDEVKAFHEEKIEALRLGLQFPFDYPEDDWQDEALVKDGCRVIDVIPRQSSLNVDDIKEVVQERGFKAIFSFLIGIGGSVDYQKRRERFEQFQQQEVYAAGFGKGLSTFGWTFNPMPGTKRLAPGVRTTYAVVVVPRDATKLVLSSKGKALIPTDLHTEPNFTGEPIKIDIPSGPNEGFFVTRIDYPHVEKDERSVVVLRGNFSSQTGILINGTPLTRTVGVANPWLGSEHGGTTLELGEPDTSIKGYFEVVNSNYLVMNFRMPKDFEGVPKITLVTPNRARALNDIQMSINGSPGKLDDEFRVGDPPPDKPPLKITAVQFSTGAGISPGARVASIAAEVNLTIGGVKNAPLRIYFNATECDGVRRAGGCYLAKIADQFYHLNVTLPYNLEKVSFSVVQDKEVNTSNVDNPIFGKAVASTVVYDQGDEEDGDDDSVTITFAGSRVNDFSPFAAGAEFVEWQSQSFSQGVLLVKNLRMPIVVVRLTDRLTGIQSTAVSITKRPPKKKKPQPPGNQAAGPANSNE